MTELRSPAVRPAFAVAMLVLACLCWGLSFPCWKALSQWWSAADPSASTAFTAAWSLSIRFLAAGLVLAGALAVSGWVRRAADRRFPVTGGECQQAAALAALTALGMALQTDGLSYTQASTSAFLTQGYAVLLPLYVAWRSRAWPHPLVWLAVIMVVFGGGVLAGVQIDDLRLGRGEIETLLASVVMTGQILVIEWPRFAANDPLRMSALSFLLISLLMAPVALLLAPSPAALAIPFTSVQATSILLCLALVPTLAGIALMFAFQRHVGAVAAGIVYCTEPVFASLLALCLPALLSRWLMIGYPNEVVTMNLAIGGTLMLAALVTIQFVPRPGPK